MIYSFEVKRVTGQSGAALPLLSLGTCTAIQIAGTFVATLQLEGSNDGINWVQIGTNITAHETRQLSLVVAFLRVTTAAYTSGTPIVSLAPSWCPWKAEDDATPVGVPATIEIVSGNTQSATVGAPYTSPLVVVVKDGAGVEVPGVLVSWTVGTGPFTPLAATSTTDALGQATMTGTAATTAGSGTLVVAVASDPAITVNFNATATADVPFAISVFSGGGQSVVAGGTFALPFVALVEDQYGNPCGGIDTAWSAGETPYSFAGGGAALTGADGKASMTVTSLGPTTTQVVYADYTGDTASAEFPATVTPGPLFEIVEVTGSTQSTVVGTPYETLFAVSAQDSYGNGIPSVDIVFAGTGLTWTDATITTNINGVAQAEGIAGTTAGAVSPKATAVGVADLNFADVTATHAAPDALSVVSGSGQSATVGAAYGANTVCLCADAYGNPCDGVTIGWSGPAGASAIPGAVTSVTNASGQATMSWTANTTAGGPYNVEASYLALSPAQFGFANTADIPDAISVVSGSGQSATVAAAFGAGLVVQVVDQYSNPCSGITVTYSPPGVGASCTLDDANPETDASGQATSTPTANTTAGANYTVTATFGALTPAEFTLTNSADVPDSVSVFSGDGQSATVGDAYASALVCLVLDQYSNPCPSITIDWSKPGAGASVTLGSPSSDTGADGKASNTITANTTAGGPFNVTATYTAGALSDDFPETNTPDVPDTITLISGDAQSSDELAEFAAPLVVRIEDQYGNACADGLEVTFTPTPGASGCSCTFDDSTPVTSGGTGQASCTPTANDHGGAYTVSCSYGALVPVEFGLTNDQVLDHIVVTSAGSATRVEAGATLQFTAEGHDKGDDVMSISPSWDTSNHSYATSDASGLVTGVARGTCDVTATVGLVVGTFEDLFVWATLFSIDERLEADYWDDASDGSVLPQTSADCVAQGWPAPTGLFLCDETSGNLVDEIASVQLQAGGTALQNRSLAGIKYDGTFNGKKCIETYWTSGGYFKCTDTASYNVTTGDFSLSWLVRCWSGFGLSPTLSAKWNSGQGYIIDCDAATRIRVMLQDSSLKIHYLNPGIAFDGGLHLITIAVDRDGNISGWLDNADPVTTACTSTDTLSNSVAYTLSNYPSGSYPFQGQIAWNYICIGTAVDGTGHYALWDALFPWRSEYATHTRAGTPLFSRIGSSLYSDGSPGAPAHEWDANTTTLGLASDDTVSFKGINSRVPTNWAPTNCSVSLTDGPQGAKMAARVTLTGASGYIASSAGTLSGSTNVAHRAGVLAKAVTGTEIRGTLVFKGSPSGWETFTDCITSDAVSNAAWTKYSCSVAPTYSNHTSVTMQLGCATNLNAVDVSHPWVIGAGATVDPPGCLLVGATTAIAIPAQTVNVTNDGTVLQAVRGEIRAVIQNLACSSGKGALIWSDSNASPYLECGRNGDDLYFTIRDSTRAEVATLTATDAITTTAHLVRFCWDSGAAIHGSNRMAILVGAHNAAPSACTLVAEGQTTNWTPTDDDHLSPFCLGMGNSDNELHGAIQTLVIVSDVQPAL